MIALALYVSFGVLVVLMPCLAVARYLEWRAQDMDRRIERLRRRRRMA